MITVPEHVLNKGAAYKAVYVLSELERIEMARTKDVVAVAPDRETALELKQNIIDSIEDYNHNQTGKMENSVAVRKSGDEYEVAMIDYAKYVNGYDRESTGAGFIDDAVNQTILDTGEDVQILV